MATTNDLTRFVAVDVETTGTDPAKDEIIELGAVRVVHGRIAEHFERLVAPRRPIPKAITRITGITDGDCAGKPPLTILLPEYLSFLGTDTIVAHNASFDLSFLDHGLKRLRQGRIDRKVHDTLLLSRILLPCLRNHQLGTLLAHFEIPAEDSHRAAADAHGAARLFLALLEYTSHFDQRTLQGLLGFCSPGSPLYDFFETALRMSPLKTIAAQKSREQGPHFSRAEGGRTRKKDLAAVCDVAWIEHFLGRDGGLTKTLPQFEHRPEQVKMATEVAGAFNNGEFLMVEAGTGVGKTMAYLTPAVLWALGNGQRVIVSTRTKTLQEQLFYKDIPLLRVALGRPFRAALMKGRSNYLCLNRWHRTLAEGFHSQAERSDVFPLILWVEETDSGDISENTGFWRHQHSGLWNRICSESSECAGSRCNQAQRCFYQKARKAAQEAHILVVNHSLLLSDARMDHTVLDRYGHLIVDEAHGLEKTATQHFGCTVSLRNVQAFLGRLQRAGKVETGLLPFLARRVDKAAVGKKVKGDLVERIGQAGEIVCRARARASELFADMALALRNFAKAGQESYALKWRYEGRDALKHLDMVSLAGELELLAERLPPLGDELLELAGRLPADAAEMAQALKGLSLAGQELSADLRFLLRADDKGYVYWIEQPGVKDEEIAMCAVPLAVGEILADRFYRSLRMLVLTSGTLTVGGRFDYAMENLGLDQERTACCVTGTPFDYTSQTRLCVPSFLPSPKAPSFQHETARLIRDVALATRRSTMALFTSYEMLAATCEDIRGKLEREGIPVLAQGADGSRSRLIDQFKDERPSLLLGTESFWEGVDMPGEALEILVIAKLPFAVPTEPVIQARMELLERQGKDAFQEYSLPEAVIKLRQGFGRLIRTRQDTGMVVLCDTRVVTARYGRLFLDSLPTSPVIYTDRTAFLNDMKQWL